MVRPKRIITTQTSDVQNDVKSKENGQKSLRGTKRGKRKQVGDEKIAKQRKVEEIRSHPRHNRGPGFVLVQGQGDVGQLGLGEDVMERKRPARVPLDKNIVDVCAGGMHTICLTDDGEVYTFGCNDEGALGRDTSQEGSEFIPGKVDIPGRVVQVSAGDSHTVALTEDGRAFIWGNFRDSKGAMGLVVKEQQQPKPLHILPLVKVQKIASGCDHLVLLSHDGYLYTSGCGEQGQLGRIAECFTLRGGRKGLDLLLTPAKVNIAKSKKSGVVLFDDVWAGFHATFARAKDTGDIYACGLNNYHQLGVTEVDMRFVLQTVPSFLNKKWQRVACGLHHTLALDDSGQVHALGRREYGRLGLGESTEDKDSPSPILAVDKCFDISCGISTSYAVAENGQLHAWGMGVGNDDEDVWEPTIIRGKQLDECKVVAVGGGGQHVVFLAVSTTK